MERGPSNLASIIMEGIMGESMRVISRTPYG
jgi:hypothetical protein